MTSILKALDAFAIFSQSGVATDDLNCPPRRAIVSTAAESNVRPPATPVIRPSAVILLEAGSVKNRLPNNGARVSQSSQGWAVGFQTHIKDGTTLKIGLTEGQKVPFGSHLQRWNSL